MRSCRVEVHECIDRLRANRRDLVKASDPACRRRVFVLRGADAFHLRLESTWFIEATCLHVHPAGGKMDGGALLGHASDAERAPHATRFHPLRCAGEAPGRGDQGKGGSRRASIVRNARPGSSGSRSRTLVRLDCFPFLLCDGMVINRSMRNEFCDGVLKTEPPIRRWG